MSCSVSFTHNTSAMGRSTVALHSMGRIAAGAALIIMLLAGCSSSPNANDDISKTVQQSMQQKFDTDPDFSKYHIQVEKVTVIKASGNQYQGTATVRTLRSSSERQVPIDVTADGTNVMWQARPGALLFLAQEQITSPDNSAGSGGSSSGAAAAAPVGTPVRDGQMQFVVTSMRRAPSVTGGYTASGEFFILGLSVTNVGNEAQT